MISFVSSFGSRLAVLAYFSRCFASSCDAVPGSSLDTIKGSLATYFLCHFKISCGGAEEIDRDVLAVS